MDFCLSISFCVGRVMHVCVTLQVTAKLVSNVAGPFCVLIRHGGRSGVKVAKRSKACPLGADDPTRKADKEQDNP